MDFLQFQRYFIPQEKLKEAFIYIIHKPIDFSHILKSYDHRDIGLKQVRVSSGNLVLSPSKVNHSLSLSELAYRK